MTTVAFVVLVILWAVAVLWVLHRFASTEVERARREQYRRNLAERRRAR